MSSRFRHEWPYMCGSLLALLVPFLVFVVRAATSSRPHSAEGSRTMHDAPATQPTEIHVAAH